MRLTISSLGWGEMLCLWVGLSHNNTFAWCTFGVMKWKAGRKQ